jgi:hypothetical protein
MFVTIVAVGAIRVAFERWAQRETAPSRLLMMVARTPDCAASLPTAFWRFAVVQGLKLDVQ